MKSGLTPLPMGHGRLTLLDMVAGVALLGGLACRSFKRRNP